MDLLKVLGLDASRAQALIDRGYDGPWKIARAKEDQLARIPEVGPIAARKMVASFHLLNYAPPKRTKESVAQDEYECPLCGCVTSAFSSDCLECGAPFDEEEMEEDIRRAFAQEGSAALIAFYDGRLAKRPDDAEMLYARGLLLDSVGRVDAAVTSLDLAVSLAPEATRGLADLGARCPRGRPFGRRTRGVPFVGGTRADQGRRPGLAHRRTRGVDGPRDADRPGSDRARGSEGDARG